MSPLKQKLDSLVVSSKDNSATLAKALLIAIKVIEEGLLKSHYKDVIEINRLITKETL